MLFIVIILTIAVKHYQLFYATWLQKNSHGMWSGQLLPKLLIWGPFTRTVKHYSLKSGMKKMQLVVLYWIS